jgi:hypothetical protein
MMDRPGVRSIWRRIADGAQCEVVKLTDNKGHPLGPVDEVSRRRSVIVHLVQTEPFTTGQSFAIKADALAAEYEPRSR